MLAPDEAALTDDRAGSDADADGGDVAFPSIRWRLQRRVDRVVHLARHDRGRLAEITVSAAVVVVCTWLVLMTLHPGDLWRNTTPTGGDMGAHVWGPRYLMDHLIPQGRLTGWTPDWYDGFPAYQFYMVVPSLMIVILTVGLAWYAAVPVVLGLAAAVVAAWSKPRLYPYRRIITGVAVALTVLTVALPYNRSFKLITGLGLLGLPAACWAFAKLSDLPFPIPPLVSAASLIFLYNREPIYNNTGNIIGGNFTSTMAGEFAFSISLTIAVLYLGVAARGLKTGRHRPLAAALFALASLCHLIPAFFVLGCTGALVLLHPDRARLKWLATMVPVAGLLTAFWVLPFWWRRDYVNDMGWEKLPLPGAELTEAGRTIGGNQSSVSYYLFPNGLKYLLIVAAFGIVASLVRRYRVGLVLALAWLGVAGTFVFLPQARLWNARLLPFMYLSVSLLAAIGLGEFIRVVAAAFNGRPHRPMPAVTVTLTAVSALGVLAYTALPLNGVLDSLTLPITKTRIDLIGTRTVSDGTATVNERYLNLPVLGSDLHVPLVNLTLRSPFRTSDANPVGGWSRWNYSGLEAKVPTSTSGGWPEYSDLMATMAGLGQDPAHGCGRAFWEYDNDRINGYGTPMAPMLLPYWTDGCIGSQEGLYFESSTTVPFHFLVQSELSAKPSNPQRGLPYPGFDFDTGIRHLQMLGVRYYIAVSPTAIAAADTHDALTPVAVSGPWHVYEIADAPLVEGLAYQPVVVEGMGESQDDWLPTASAWFLAPDTLDVPLVDHGPKDWKRVKVEPVPKDLRPLVRFTREQLGKTGPMDQLPELPRTRLPEVEVTNIRHDRSSISFDVSKVGVPVVVKTSYFPNWRVTGADRIYRISPNLMLVVPTSTHVRLDYTRTPVDLAATGLTLLGLVGLWVLSRRGPVAVEPETPPRLSVWLDDLIAVPSARSDAGEPAAAAEGAGDGAGEDEVPEAVEAPPARDPETAEVVPALDVDDEIWVVDADLAGTASATDGDVDHGPA